MESEGVEDLIHLIVATSQNGKHGTNHEGLSGSRWLVIITVGSTSKEETLPISTHFTYRAYIDNNIVTRITPGAVVAADKHSPLSYLKLRPQLVSS